MLNQMAPATRHKYLGQLDPAQRATIEGEMVQRLSPEEWIRYLSSLTPVQRAAARAVMLAEMLPEAPPCHAPGQHRGDTPLMDLTHDCRRECATLNSLAPGREPPWKA